MCCRRGRSEAPAPIACRYEPGAAVVVVVPKSAPPDLTLAGGGGLYGLEPLVTPAFATLRLVAPLSSETASTADAAMAATPAIRPNALTENTMAPSNIHTPKPVSLARSNRTKPNCEQRASNTRSTCDSRLPRVASAG